MVHDPNADPLPARGGAVPYRGHVTLTFSPEADGEPDPGEIVWTWVPYEEDPSVGKDRPVVVLGTADDDPGAYAVLMVSSRAHIGDSDWLPIGAGDWDRDRRPSFVRLDRLLKVTSRAVRREGAALSADQYRAVVAALRNR